MTNRDSIHKRLTNELAIEKVNNELEQRNKERNIEVNKQINNAQRQLQQRLSNADNKVLEQLQNKRILAQSSRKRIATSDLRQQNLQLEKQKVEYYKLIEQQSRLSQIVSDFKNNSQIQNLKQQAVLKDLQVKRQRLLGLIQQSKIRQETLMKTIDDLQSQL